MRVHSKPHEFTIFADGNADPKQTLHWSQAAARHYPVSLPQSGRRCCFLSEFLDSGQRVRPSCCVGNDLVASKPVAIEQVICINEVTVRSFEDARSLIEAIFSRGRLGLPFDGILPVSY
jgi:hypothetical protein